MGKILNSFLKGNLFLLKAIVNCATMISSRLVYRPNAKNKKGFYYSNFYLKLNSKAFQIWKKIKL